MFRKLRSKSKEEDESKPETSRSIQEEHDVATAAAVAAEVAEAAVAAEAAEEVEAAAAALSNLQVIRPGSSSDQRQTDIVAQDSEDSDQFYSEIEVPAETIIPIQDEGVSTELTYASDAESTNIVQNEIKQKPVLKRSDSTLSDGEFNIYRDLVSTSHQGSKNNASDLIENEEMEENDSITSESRKLVETLIAPKNDNKNDEVSQSFPEDISDKNIFSEDISFKNIGRDTETKWKKVVQTTRQSRLERFRSLAMSMAGKTAAASASSSPRREQDWVEVSESPRKEPDEVEVSEQISPEPTVSSFEPLSSFRLAAKKISRMNSLSPVKYENKIETIKPVDPSPTRSIIDEEMMAVVQKRPYSAFEELSQTFEPSKEEIKAKRSVSSADPVRSRENIDVSINGIPKRIRDPDSIGEILTDSFFDDVLSTNIPSESYKPSVPVRKNNYVDDIASAKTSKNASRTTSSMSRKPSNLDDMVQSRSTDRSKKATNKSAMKRNKSVDRSQKSGLSRATSRKSLRKENVTGRKSMFGSSKLETNSKAQKMASRDASPRRKTAKKSEKNRQSGNDGSSPPDKKPNKGPGDGSGGNNGDDDDPEMSDPEISVALDEETLAEIKKQAERVLPLALKGEWSAVDKALKYLEQIRGTYFKRAVFDPLKNLVDEVTITVYLLHIILMGQLRTGANTLPFCVVYACPVACYTFGFHVVRLENI